MSGPQPGPYVEQTGLAGEIREAAQRYSELPEHARPVPICSVGDTPKLAPYEDRLHFLVTRNW